MLSGIEAIIFDFDGTLAALNIDFALMRKRIMAISARYGLKEAEIGSLYALEMVEESKRLLDGRRSAAVRDFLIEANSAIEEIELEASAKGCLLPGIVPMMERLKENGYPIGIVSRNCEKAIKRVFPDVELHCKAFLPRDKVEKVKPHPEHLHKALGLLGVDGRNAAYVGDHLMDVKAGKEAGIWTTIGVLTGRIKEAEFKEAGADLVLKIAAHLPHHLPWLNSAGPKSPMRHHSLPSTVADQ